MGYDTCRLVHQIGFARGTSQGEVSLLELPREQLKRNQVCSIYGFIHWVDNSLGSVVFTPDRGDQSTRLSVHSHRRYGISARDLDWGHVESECISVAVRAANMESRVALQARCACAVGCLAKLTDCVVPKCWCSYSLHHVETCRAAELDFRMPYCTIHVHPVVVSGALERFTGYKRSTLLLLPKAILVLGFVNKLLL